MKPLIKYLLKILLLFSIGMIVSLVFSFASQNGIVVIAASICFYGSIIALNTFSKK